MNTPADAFLASRQLMVDEQLCTRGLRDERVLAAMRRVPRHLFVPENVQDNAYADTPLPIGQGQTISQPFIVAYMLEILRLKPGDRVLEIGTGSGYQTALLAELVSHVYSVERNANLSEMAKRRLESLNYKNISFHVGDGSEGLLSEAPFDAITVGAAAPAVPPALFSQLREGGRMILPVGMQQAQDLLLVRKIQGQQQVQHMEGCRFVPLIGKQGFEPAG